MREDVVMQLTSIVTKRQATNIENHMFQMSNTPVDYIRNVNKTLYLLSPMPPPVKKKKTKKKKKVAGK
jgi:hypothetical protein